MDVVSLYPSTQQREAAKVVANIYDENRHKNYKTTTRRRSMEDVSQKVTVRIIHVMRDTHSFNLMVRHIDRRRALR